MKKEETGEQDFLNIDFIITNNVRRFDSLNPRVNKAQKHSH